MDQEKRVAQVVIEYVGGLNLFSSLLCAVTGLVYGEWDGFRIAAGGIFLTAALRWMLDILSEDEE
jgi:uncharacterized membrane protein YdjX (TVP38/TMEM64 family)